jgi:hypothetical protein
MQLMELSNSREMKPAVLPQVKGPEPAGTIQVSDSNKPTSTNPPELRHSAPPREGGAPPPPRRLPKNAAEQDWNNARDKAMTTVVERMMKSVEAIERAEKGGEMNGMR